MCAIYAAGGLCIGSVRLHGYVVRGSGRTIDWLAKCASYDRGSAQFVGVEAWADTAAKH